MRACSACGHGNADSAKFCSECGAGLTAAPAGRHEERKVVSVVFVDLVGSTARAEASDPEDVRALLRVYHERARDELERFGGTLEKFIGDAVVAVFGAPVAHEDDPERAVRAAIAVREAVAGLNEEEPGRDLHVRIAVNTGEALVSLDAALDEGEGMVAGDVVNTAARLQSAAPVDGILVGEQTYRATDRAIAYREAAPVEAKGKSEPIPVWEAVEARSRFGVDIGGAGRAELVGRDAELELLAGALLRSRRERSTQLVTLVGVPGIGKSRLVYELSRLVDADSELIAWRQGRSLPYGEGVTFWALGEIVKAQAGILESDTADDTDAKLADAVASLPDEQERAWVARHLRPLVGLAADESPEDRRGESFAAWRRFLEALAEAGPTVLVFEDLHWADDGLLDFVDGLVDWVDGVPLLVVATARPELLDRRPGWGGGKRNASTISLAALDGAATGRLVLALLDRSVLDADTQQLLVERAAGNPLYAEEFVRMLDAGGPADGRLPESVQGIVAARIDLLSPAEKTLLQNASVLGKVVWSDALAELGGVDPHEAAETLRSLERKEFVRRERLSAVAGALQYSFVHALVRDAAYLQLPRADRAERHLAAARWIESLPDDRAEDRAETVAHHYVTAIDLSRAAGADVAELGARAVPALQEAGERALALGAYDTATRFFDRALEHLPAGEEPSPELLLAAGTAFGYSGRMGDELARAVEAFERTGDPERAAEAAMTAFLNGWHAGSGETGVWLDRAAELLVGRPASRASARLLGLQARDALMKYRIHTGGELARRAVELARQLGDVESEAYSLITVGCGRIAAGDADGVRELEAALELVGGRGAVAGRALTNLGWAYAVRGDQRRAREYSVEAAKHSEREGDLQSAWFAKGNIATSDFQLGAWDDVLATIDAFDAAPEGVRYQRDRLISVGAAILAARDRGAEGLAQIRDVVAETSARAVDLQGLWPDMASYARLALRQGLREEADAALDKLVEGLLANESGGEAGWQVELVLALCEADREPQAREIVAQMPPGDAREISEAIVAGDEIRAADVVALGGDGDLRLAADMRLQGARRLVRAGRLAEAEAQLELAREFWRRVGATSHLREADELLEPPRTSSASL